jgi:hypothetical protein
MSISSSADVVNILDALRRKIHQSPEAAVEAARGHLAAYVLESIEDALPDDEVGAQM